MASQLLKTETLRHKQAFEYYHKLGEKRTLPQVSQQYAISLVTAKQWSASFHWADRVIERDEIVADAIARHATNDTIKERSQILQTTQMVMADFTKRAHPDYDGDNKITIMTGIDYERMAKLYLLMMGEVTDRVEELQVVFSTGAKGEDWTQRDAKIHKPALKDRGNGSEAKA